MALVFQSVDGRSLDCGNGRLGVGELAPGRLLDSARQLERWEDTIELDVTDAERDVLRSTSLSFQGRRFLATADASPAVHSIANSANDRSTFRRRKRLSGARARAARVRGARHETMGESNESIARWRIALDAMSRIGSWH